MAITCNIPPWVMGFVRRTQQLKATGFKPSAEGIQRAIDVIVKRSTTFKPGANRAIG